MQFKTKVKLSGINNLSNARFAAAAGIDYMGFCFDPPAPGYIPPIHAKEIIDWVSGGNIVAEFANQSLDEIREISALLPIDIIEVNNMLLPEELLEIGKPVIKKINVAAFTMEGIEKECEAYFKVADAFHFYTDNAQEDLYAPELQGLCSRYSVIWGLPLSTQNIARVVDHFKPYGVNLNAGEEEKTGMRDFEDLNDLLDQIISEES